MFYIYRFLTNCSYPFLIIFIFLRIFKKKEDPKRYKEKIFTKSFSVSRNKKKLVWFHAASVGEAKSILPIIKELNHGDDIEFLITTVTFSSGELLKDEIKELNNVQHRYFPFDIDFLMKQFISLWKPDAVFLVDSEIWPNLIFNVKKNKIPLAIINARITAKTFKKWMIIKDTARTIFNTFDLCLCSNLETKKYLEILNSKNIYYNGNIKLINNIDLEEITNHNKEFLLSNRFWFAVSTHKNEELLCLQTHLKLKEKFGNVITIIAPRHINRVNEIKTLCKKFSLNSQILKKDEIISKNNDIIILNSFGELNKYFKYSKSVFIGKSTIKKLENVGGQNPIDAAKLGCKIYHGPYTYNFKEIYEILKNHSISHKINDSEDLYKNLAIDLKNTFKDNKKFSILMNNLGQKTLADTMKNMRNFLFNETL